MRALLLPGFFLACDVLLVVAGRSSLIGPIIGYEFRYISELSAVTAAALAFATMPLRGAVEQVQPRRPSVLLDRRRPGDGRLPGRGAPRDQLDGGVLPALDR